MANVVEIFKGQKTKQPIAYIKILYKVKIPKNIKLVGLIIYYYYMKCYNQNAHALKSYLLLVALLQHLSSK